MIERFGRVLGIKLFRIGNRQAELWFCPRGEAIPMHIHKHIISKIVFLGGRMRWAGMGRIKELGFRNIFKSWTIPANDSHGAVVTGKFGIFLNWEIWDGKISSASKDIELV